MKYQFNQSINQFILINLFIYRQSLEELKPIFSEILQIKSSTDGIPVMLVGNKSDESSAREVSTAEGAALAKVWKSAFMETSAKTNHNVQELFQELLQLEKRRTMTLQLDSKKISIPTEHGPVQREMHNHVVCFKIRSSPILDAGQPETTQPNFICSAFGR